MAGPQYIGSKITEGADGRVIGMASFYYNSAESHLIANAAVESTIPPCLTGAMAIEAKPDFYVIDIGTEQQRIEIFPGCTGFGGGGWLHLTKQDLELGVFVAWHAGGSVHIGFGIGSADIWAEAGAELGLKAAFELEPKFLIKKAGIWVLVYARVGVDYDVGVDSGTIIIADAELRGELTVYFEDRTRVQGLLAGHIKVIGIGANFDMEFDHSF